MSNETEFTDSNFQAQTENGLSLIDFWAPWCGPCRTQGPIVEEVAQEMADKATIGKCNVDDNPDISTKFGVRSIPTIIIIKDGEEVERMVGVQTGDTLRAKLNEHLT